MAYVVDMTKEQLMEIPSDKIAKVIFVHEYDQVVIHDNGLTEQETNLYILRQFFPLWDSYDNIPVVNVWSKNPKDYKSFFHLVENDGLDDVHRYRLAYFFTDIGFGQIAVNFIIDGIADRQDTLKEHLETLKNSFSHNSGFESLEKHIERLVGNGMLPYAAEAIDHELQLSLKDDCHSYQAKNIPGAYIAVSTIPSLDYENISRYIPGGYLALFDKLIRESGYSQGGIDLFHWIYCYSKEQTAIHCSFLWDCKLPQEENRPIIAQDFLTLDEKKDLSIR